MHNTSDQFKQAIYAPSRTIKGKVTFDISPTTIDADTITATSTEQFILSDINQLNNNLRESSYKLATYEVNRFRLDGSFSFADDNLLNNREVGWISNRLSDSDGTFIKVPMLDFIFQLTHDSAGITITFNEKENEYATDFNVRAYDQNNNLIDDVEVRDNTQIQRQVYGQFLGYSRINIVITKWSTGFRRARVLEVDFGIVQEYSDDSLIGMNLLEEIDLTSATLPSAEFKFTVENTERLFNILNPEGFYKFLQQRQQVIAQLGIEIGNNIEWVQLGNYLLWEWISDEGSLTASFIARTNLDLMSNYLYENTIPKENYTLKTMAEEIFTVCGITNYELDPILGTITTMGMVSKTNCLEVLKMIALAGMVNVFVTRNNKIKITRIPEIIIPKDVIDMDNMYSEPKITLEKTVKNITVSYFIDMDTTETVVFEDQGVSIGDLITLDNNTLINSSSHAEEVARWLIKQSNYRSKYDLSWRGNMGHELLDGITIENSFTTDTKAVITKNELSYQGYLQAKTEAKGGII